MRYVSLLTLSLVASASAASPSAAQRGDDYTAARDATVNASGAKRIRIDARAGSLRVTGKSGITEARIKGMAGASEKAMLEDIALEAKREGDEVLIRAKVPEFNGGDGWDWRRGGRHAYLDLIIEVPLGSVLDVEDSSGDIEVRGVGALTLIDASGEIEIYDVGGPVEIEDHSGSIRLERVKGNVRISDSSGDLEIRDVTGSVTVDEDSSGEIDITDVTGTVHVRRDSSGSISVASVGGDFKVDRDGSGGIDYRGVKGTVEIPRKRGRHDR